MFMGIVKNFRGLWGYNFIGRIIRIIFINVK